MSVLRKYALIVRDVDPHSFLRTRIRIQLFFLNADPDPAAFLMRIRIHLSKMCTKLPYEEFSGVEKDKNIAPNLLNIF